MNNEYDLVKGSCKREDCIYAPLNLFLSGYPADQIDRAIMFTEKLNPMIKLASPLNILREVRTILYA